MENNNSKLAIAIVASAAAGAIAWYLISSENGKQNWKTLLDVVKDVSDKLMVASAENRSLLAAAGKEASEFIGKSANRVMEDVKQYT